MSEQSYEPLEIHLKRIDLAINSWMGQAIAAQTRIQYNGNVVCRLTTRSSPPLTDADRKQLESSWHEISEANKIQDLAEQKLQELKEERRELIEIATISTAKEFLRGVNTEKYPDEMLKDAPFGR